MKATSIQASTNRVTLLFFLLLFSYFGILHADDNKQEWFQGGTLHDAIVSDWKAASAENKLATASDWLSSTLWKGKLTSYEAFEKMKVKSQMLVDAIDGVVAGQDLGNTIAIEIAAGLVSTSNDLGP